MTSSKKEASRRFVVSETEVEGRVIKHIAPVVPELRPWAETEIVGHPVPRVDGYEKVTGKARYTADVQLPGMLYAAAVASPYPHARVRRMDVERVKKIPGVKAVLTPADVRSVRWFGMPLLAEEPRYAGEFVAAVCAVDRDTALEAARALQVDYQPLPFVVDLEEAMRPGAVNVTPRGNVTNAVHPDRFGEPGVYRRGDLEAGFRGADMVLERTFRTAAVTHLCMEPHGTVAYRRGGDLYVFESTQGVFFIQEHIARSLNLPLNRVHVSCRHMGGGFGSKNSAKPQTLLACLLAEITGRPVHFVLTRELEILGPWYRPASIQKLKMGFRKDGTLTALRLESYHQVGAYPMGVNWGSCETPARELYRCPNVETVNHAVMTHTPPPAAMRAPGHVQGAWALEQMMDIAARELGIDPVELRLKNLPDRDQVSGLPYASNGLKQALVRGAEAFGWPAEKKARNPGERFVRGVGVAAQIWGGGGGPPAGAVIEVNHDGTVQLLTGAADLGTGTRTVLAQIVAEELKIPLHAVTVYNADTSTTPYTLPSFGSLTLASSGPAVRTAAAEARKILTSLAALLLDASPDGVELDREGFYIRTNPDHRIPFARVCARIPSRTLVVTGERGPNPARSLRTFGAQFVEVEVDRVTGRVRVTRIVAAHDSGRVINPRTWGNQVYGGVTMGLGYGLLEQRRLDPATGRVLTVRYTDYKIATHRDVPPDFTLVDPAVPYPANSIGAKGVGEPPVIPTAPAVANAVFDAVGIRIFDAPITPKKILESA